MNDTRIRHKIDEWRRIANPESAYGQAMIDCADELESLLEGDRDG